MASNNNGRVATIAAWALAGAVSVAQADSAAEQHALTRCAHLRDETVAGEAAGVCEFHQKNDIETIDGQVWISTRTRLPVRKETDVSNALGKSHASVQANYTNTGAPNGAT